MKQRSNASASIVKFGVSQIKVYPSREQKALLFKTFGANRWFWNQIKSMTDQRYQNNPHLFFPSAGSLKILLPQLKKEHAWLKEVNSTSLQATAEYYCNAQEAFFKQTPVGRKPPKFKSRHYYLQTATFKNVSYKTKGINHEQIYVLDPHHISIGKKLVLRTSSLKRLVDCKIKRLTIKYRQDLDQFFMSVIVEKEKKLLYNYQEKAQKTKRIVGIDVGLGNEWLVTSDGDRWSVPDTFALEKEKNKRQSHTDRNRTAIEKRVARFNHEHKETKIDKYDFQNWQKLRKTKSKYQLMMNNKRTDYIQQTTTWLVKHYDVIVIEDLKTKNLLHNHKLAHNIANAGWSMFRRMLEYKCRWYGKKLIVVHPQYTSRICSNCHKANPKFNHMKTRDWLAVREWTCPFCHAHHDRDINASKNILMRAVA